MEKIRIQKLIADSGYCSRRKAEELISKGRVKLNGRPVKLGDKASDHSAATLTTLADGLVAGVNQYFGQ